MAVQVVPSVDVLGGLEGVTLLMDALGKVQVVLLVEVLEVDQEVLLSGEDNKNLYSQFKRQLHTLHISI